MTKKSDHRRLRRVDGGELTSGQCRRQDNFFPPVRIALSEGRTDRELAVRWLVLRLHLARDVLRYAEDFRKILALAPREGADAG